MYLSPAKLQSVTLNLAKVLLILGDVKTPD